MIMLCSKYMMELLANKRFGATDVKDVASGTEVA